MDDSGKAADRVLRLARALPASQFQVLSLTAGIEGETYSLKEVARIFKVTLARVQQKRQRAIEIIALAFGEEMTDDQVERLLVAGITREKADKKAT